MLLPILRTITIMRAMDIRGVHQAFGKWWRHKAFQLSDTTPLSSPRPSSTGTAEGGVLAFAYLCYKPSMSPVSKDHIDALIQAGDGPSRESFELENAFDDELRHV